MQAVVQRFSNFFQTAESANYKYVNDVVNARAHTFQTVCLGDSMTKFGVAPAVLQTYTRKPTFNLAMVGSTPINSYVALSKLIANGASLNSVLVDFEPGILRINPLKSIHESSELTDPAAYLDLILNLNKSDYPVALSVSACVPTYRLKHQILNILMTKLRLKPKLKTKDVKISVDTWSQNEGQNVVEPQVQGDLPWKAIIKERTPWFCDDINKKYIDKFCRLAAAKNIKVYWLLVPMHPGAQKAIDEAKIDTAYDGFVKALVAPYPLVKVLDGRQLLIGAEHFAEGSHLDKNGAKLYSQALGRFLAAEESYPTNEKWHLLKSTDIRLK